MKSSILSEQNLNSFSNDLLDKARDLQHEFTPEEMLGVTEQMFHKIIAHRVAASMASVLNAQFIGTSNTFVNQSFLQKVLRMYGVCYRDGHLELESIDQMKRASPIIADKLTELEEKQWAVVEPLILQAIEKEIEDSKSIANNKNVVKKVKATVQRHLDAMISYDDGGKIAKTLINRLYTEVKETSEVPLMWLAVLDKGINKTDA